MSWTGSVCQTSSENDVFGYYLVGITMFCYWAWV